MFPSPACGRGRRAAPGEGRLVKSAHFPTWPSLPAFGGTLSRERERGQACGRGDTNPAA
ncbi:hypothetical protein WQQ_14220 [Hydrocarboniphaga effusa AP103]|uniref:Uncharacterized protein n=1 Tax=Hydrocarboniphaga effusa AP103 TaxID=1172194 RepID=I8TBN0_9GAMM|nr:hypothetical protein WQQ_14220 [Hydrocarboniphaga effusa AP103]